MPATAGRQTLFRQVLDGTLEIVPWTVEQYRRAVENGWLPEDTGTELVNGLIIRKDRSAAGEDPMTIGDRHRLCTQRLARLDAQFRPFGCFVQKEDPVAMPPDGEPEPDIAVVRADIEDYADGPPGPADVLCVIEVSDSSLLRDTTVKRRVYAEAGVPVYVVVDLQHDAVLVHRDPNPADGTYPPPATLGRGDVLALPAGGGHAVEVLVDRLF